MTDREHWLNGPVRACRIRGIVRVVGQDGRLRYRARVSDFLYSKKEEFSLFCAMRCTRGQEGTRIWVAQRIISPQWDRYPLDEMVFYF